MRTRLFFCLLLAPVFALAQTTHPLLLAMQEKARTVDYGSYQLEVRECYPYATDTIVCRADCAFARFEQLDGKPGLRYDLEYETRQGSQVSRQRVVFDGQIKYDFRGDTLVMLYDVREVGPEYTMRGAQNFFFIPMLLHPWQVQHFLGPDKYLGVPPYQTLGDTVIGQTPCHWVGADWALDSASLNWQHIRFGISKTTNLPVYFSHVDETRSEYNNKPRFHTLEIRIAQWSGAPPVNTFYVDWFGLPAGYEVKQFHDCYHRETLRPRNHPGL